MCVCGRGPPPPPPRSATGHGQSRFVGFVGVVTGSSPLCGAIELGARINDTSSSLARRTSSLTMVTSNSARRPARPGRSAGAAPVPPRSRCPDRPGAGPARPSDGGARKTNSAPGMRLADLAGALEVDLEQRQAALGERALDRAARGAVLGAAVHDRVLEELARLDQPVELGVVDEVVVHAVDLAGTRAGGWSSRRRARPPGSGSRT